MVSIPWLAIRVTGAGDRSRGGGAALIQSVVGPRAVADDDAHVRDKAPQGTFPIYT
jgi:hypothetical protein